MTVNVQRVNIDPPGTKQPEHQHGSLASATATQQQHAGWRTWNSLNDAQLRLRHPGTVGTEHVTKESNQDGN